MRRRATMDIYKDSVEAIKIAQLYDFIYSRWKDAVMW
jgi:hypothetical protein